MFYIPTARSVGRWSDKDFNFLIFKFWSTSEYSRSIGAEYRTCQDEDGPSTHNAVFLYFFYFGMMVVLPNFLKSVEVKRECYHITKLTPEQRIAQGYENHPGYYKEHLYRKYGFSYSFENKFLQLFYGIQSDDSDDKPKVKSYFNPITSLTYISNTKSSIKDNSGLVTLTDTDGTKLYAQFGSYTQTYHRGTGWFSFLRFLTKKITYHRIEINYSEECGKRKGSWKGGTLSASIPYDPKKSSVAGFVTQELKKEGLMDIEFIDTLPEGFEEPDWWFED